MQYTVSLPHALHYKSFFLLRITDYFTSTYQCPFPSCKILFPASMIPSKDPSSTLRCHAYELLFCLWMNMQIAHSYPFPEHFAASMARTIISDKQAQDLIPRVRNIQHIGICEVKNFLTGMHDASILLTDDIIIPCHEISFDFPVVAGQVILWFKKRKFPLDKANTASIHIHAKAWKKGKYLLPYFSDFLPHCIIDNQTMSPGQLSFHCIYGMPCIIVYIS